MQQVFTAKQIKEIDDILTTQYGIPPQILMENAAANASPIIRNYFQKQKCKIDNIAIFCGVGNNGGDGLALARHLAEYFGVKVVIVGDTNKMSAETKQNYLILQNLKNIVVKNVTQENELDTIELSGIDCIIDSLIGVGGSENLRSFFPALLDKINKYKAIKIAIDLPTGLAADSGASSDHTFVADLTVSITGKKIANLYHKSRKFCGEIQVATLGTSALVEKSICNNFVLEENDIKQSFGKRAIDSSKFDYGRLLVIAGSQSMPGAAALVANAGIKTGTGIVQLLSPKVHSAVLPEIIAEEIKANEAGTIHQENYDYLLESCEKAQAIAIGSGIGINEETLKMLRKLILTIDKPLVIDADALRCLKKDDKLDKNIILTPHLGEFSRLIQVPINEIKENLVKYVEKTAKEMNCNIVLKSVPTIISDSHSYFWNVTGNPGMATAGSGDVLTGIISSLLAQGLDSLKAAALGAFIHSQSGDRYLQDHSETSLTASNLIDYIKYII